MRSIAGIKVFLGPPTEVDELFNTWSEEHDTYQIQGITHEFLKSGVHDGELLLIVSYVKEANILRPVFGTGKAVN